MAEETLFELAVRTPEAERAALLDRACDGKPELRARVEALLAAHAASGDFLDRPGSDQESGNDVGLPATEDISESPTILPGAANSGAAYQTVAGAVIAGRYVLVEKIGEGGMGEVWVAKQTEPVKRRVALKLIKAGMDSKEVLNRFEQERQALAMMDHPHIARVLDGGLTPARQPFFVMELVHGMPLIKFCDASKMTPRERLELFIPICQAVQHAHQKGIVHRDLKPANILVAMVDGKPVPKVIDFGVAKATGGKLTDKSMDTQFGAIVGTLEYMSPEQAGFSNQDIDTRSDIYSLGVILYELLTGLRPIDAKRLEAAALFDMIRVIFEEEPSKPSTRLSTEESLPSLAALRRTDPKKLMAMLHGELDWVVMKCLEKERDRRYESANGLARDIQRFLADEPVEARPPSAAYRLQKFVKRHRWQAMAAGLVLLTLLGGIVGTSVGMFEAQRARAAETLKAEAEKVERLRAETAEADARIKKELAEANELKAQKRLAQIGRANDLLASIFVGIDPNQIARKDRPLQAILVEKLDKAVTELEGDAIGDPLVVARIQTQFGCSLLGLGEPGKAAVVLEKAVATLRAHPQPSQHDKLTSMNNLAAAYGELGKPNLALPLNQETFEIRLATLGRDHPDTLTSMSNLAVGYEAVGQLDKAVRLLEEVYQLSKIRHGPNHRDTLRGMHNLAEALKLQGKLRQSLSLYQEVFKLRKEKLGPDDPDTLVTANNLAGTYLTLSQVDLALPLYEETLKRSQAVLGPDHSGTLHGMHNLALALNDAGKPDLALPLLMESSQKMKAKFGPNHPDTLVCMSNLGNGYIKAGKPELAVPVLEETLKLEQASHGPSHPSTLECMHHLATAYRKIGKMNLALPLDEEVLKLTQFQFGPEHPDTIRTMNNVMLTYFYAKQYEKAVLLGEETVKRLKATLGPDAPRTIIAMDSLGVIYAEFGQPEKALPLLETSYRASQKYPSMRQSGFDLLEVYGRTRKKEQAVKLVNALLPNVRKSQPQESAVLAGQLGQFGRSLLEAQAYVEAEPLLRECLAIRKKKEPEVWTTFNSMSMLGGALAGQKKYTEAEPLLLKGYEGMVARLPQDPPGVDAARLAQNKTLRDAMQTRIAEALDRLVQLYTETNTPDEVKTWQAEKEKLPKVMEKK